MRQTSKDQRLKGETTSIKTVINSPQFMPNLSDFLSSVGHTKFMDCIYGNLMVYLTLCLEKNESHAGLERHESKQMTELLFLLFIFCTIPLNSNIL